MNRDGSPALRRAVVASGLVFAVAACGGSAAPAAAPAAPVEQSEPGATGAPQAEQGYGQSPGTPAPAAAPTQPTDQRFAEPPAEAVGPSDGTGQASLERAIGELDRAERELSAAGPDCGLACKALGSMQRATERICSLSPDTAEGSRCRRARERLGAAEGRVQRGCKC